MRVAVRKDIKDLILDAADKLLSERGFQGMTMSALADEVGIGKGTLYLHFPSKQELVLSHIDRIIFRLLVKLQTISSGKLSPDEKIIQMLITRVLFRFDSVQHYRESLFELLRDIRPALIERHRQHFQQEGRYFAEVIKEGVCNGLFQIKNPDDVAQAFIASTNSLLPYNLDAAEIGDRKRLAKRTALIATLLVNGIKGRSSPA
jgi:AcrR family transcriptional regulator